jgi:hypothetical protein
VLLRKPGVMFDAAHRGVIQAQKAEYQRETSCATHQPTMFLFHFVLMRCGRPIATFI